MLVSMKPITTVCPLEDCKQPVTVRGDGSGTYGVHFKKVTDSKPCPMSYQPLPKQQEQKQ